MTESPLCISIEPYALPLVRPWQSARGRVDERRGWLVRAEAGGRSGFGDCAPLPEAGTETPEEAAQALGQACRGLGGLGLAEALDRRPPWPPRTPAADLGIECALLDLSSRLAGIPLRRLLSAEAADLVPVNGALGALAEVSGSDLASAWGAGFRVLKLKVGLDAPRLELDRLASIAEALPSGAGLRLDANGAWDPETAARFVAALRGLPIESLEEPLVDPDPSVLAGLQSLAGFPLALDESLTPRALAGIWASPGEGPVLWGLGVRRAVLKPQRLGGLVRTLDLARGLAARGAEVLVTGALESAAGLWASAQLAAAIGSPIPQGLDTARWLAADLGAAPTPGSGLIRLPDGPGSGFEPGGPRVAP